MIFGPSELGNQGADLGIGFFHCFLLLLLVDLERSGGSHARPYDVVEKADTNFIDTYRICSKV